MPKTYELAVEKLVKHNHVDEGVYKMIIALSEVQEARVVELLKQLLHCDKSTEKSSFPLFNKSIVLEVNTTFRLSEGEWININALEQENVEKKINKSISNVKNIDVNAKEVKSVSRICSKKCIKNFHPNF